MASFLDGNQFSFTCPIFNVETKMSACVTLRNKVWRGERPEVRKGCQACMKSGKCPAEKIMHKVAFNLDYFATEYTAATPTTGKLHAEVLERILPIMVLEKTMERIGVSAKERQLILSSNERIAKMLGGAPKKAARQVAPPPKKAKAVKPKVKPRSDDNVNQAAASGDLSAAINQGGES